MKRPPLATWLLEQEARALLTRLARLQPYALNMPMVTAAAISPSAQTAIENHMIKARRELRTMVEAYIRWLRAPGSDSIPPSEAQRRFAVLKLSFNNVITQFDLFAEVLTQRSEHGTGVWVAGLDDAAADALELPGSPYVCPPVICYVVRGHGAAIRRIHTRLPGGAKNPIAIIKVPRERMVGSGIASSLIHEVGHQGAAMLDLVNSLRAQLRGKIHAGGPDRQAWILWDRWISEIVADFWSVGKLGLTSTMGLMGVVSLPRPFVFRLDVEDPHPMPYVRVLLSCAMGNALYPHPQWLQVQKLWMSLYPLGNLDPRVKAIIGLLHKTMPELAELIAAHKPARLRGQMMRQVMPTAERHPARLKSYFADWEKAPSRMRGAPPSLVFAVLGQARANGRLTPEREGTILSDMLSYWAVNSALSVSAICASRPISRALRDRQAAQISN